MSEEELSSTSKDYLHSSLRESLIEHLFVGEVLKELWLGERFQVEVLKPQVDNAGYDLAIECIAGEGDGKSNLRHIQLKASHAGAKRSSVNVSLKLTKKPNWCVIWIFFDPKDLKLGPFYWIDTSAGLDIEGLRATKHTKADATGKKKDRPGLREVPKARFARLETVEQVVDHLFPETL